MSYKNPADRKAYDAAYYLLHKGRWREAQQVRRHIKWDRVIALLGGECADCHGKFSRHIYDLHHLDKATKTSDRFLSDWGWKRILVEIAGCVLLCSNCHRERHYKIREEKLWLRS